MDNCSTVNNFANERNKSNEKYIFSHLLFEERQGKERRYGTYHGRITVDGMQAQFSCKLSIDSNLWGVKGGRAVGKSVTARETNRMLDKLRVGITKHYQEIMERDSFVTAEKVRNAFLGLEYRCQTLIKIYDHFMEDYAKKVDCGMWKSHTNLTHAGKVF